MTQDEYEVGSLENAEKFAIIRMAREAGFIPNGQAERAWLERFAALVAAHEREACAKVCEKRADSYKYATDPWAHEHISEANSCAAAIRARGE